MTRAAAALVLLLSACGESTAPGTAEATTAGTASATAMPAGTGPAAGAVTGTPAAGAGTADRPTTSIALVDPYPRENDWPVVPASDAHDAPLPPGVLPDDFSIVVRARTESAPLVELRPRAGMPGRWELVAADAETPEDPSVDLDESLIWSIEVPARRVAGIYAFVLGHEESLVCGDPAGLRARYTRRSRRVACAETPDATALRARLGELLADFGPP